MFFNAVVEIFNLRFLNSNTMSLMFAKRKNEFVFAEPFLKIKSSNSLQSTFARIVSEKAKQTELVHCL